MSMIKTDIGFSPGDKVFINVEECNKRKHISDLFQKFINESENKEFIVRCVDESIPTVPVIYLLGEGWLLHPNELIGIDQ